MRAVGIHSTPKKNVPSIQKNGLKRQPFWKNSQPFRRLLRGKLTCTPHAHQITERNLERVTSKVYDSLERANLHLAKRKGARFQIDSIQTFLVNLDASKILEHKADSAVHLESPPSALTPVHLTPTDIKVLEERTAAMQPLEANQFVAEFLTQKILSLVK